MTLLQVEVLFINIGKQTIMILLVKVRYYTYTKTNFSKNILYNKYGSFIYQLKISNVTKKNIH